MEPLGHVARRPAPALALRGDCGAILAGALLTVLATGEAVGQPGGLFTEAAPAAAVADPDVSTVSDSITLRRRLVAIDFGSLTPPVDTAATVLGWAEAAPSGVLTLNLFDDASFTGLVQSVAPTFSGGYSLSGPLAGVEMGTMTLVVNGETVAGTVRTPEATYRIRPAAVGLHAVSQVDPSRLPPLGEPIPGRGWEEEARPPLGLDSGLPVPVEPRSAPPVVPGAFRAAEDAPSADAQGSVETDRAALEAFYDATDGPNWTDSTNWKTDAPLSEWFGVTTDANGRVVGLSIPSNDLAGAFPDELGSLVNLQWLYLSGNALTGALPSELGNLTNLHSLVLGFNELSGPIPSELGRLMNLRYLDLIYNDLSGPIPTTLGRLGALETLYLNNNELTGRLPPWLGNLDQLRGLSLSRNPLTGPFPAELWNLVNLEILLIGGLGLSGPIPSELGNLVNLTWLSLEDNDLTGPVSGLGNLVNLQRLSLLGNWGLTGPLPSVLREAPLESLVISLTQTCAPVAWREWLETIEFFGGLCGSGTDVIDVAIVYTPAAREALGGTTAVEAALDLVIAEVNQAYEASGVEPRLRLVERSEVQYTETGTTAVDLARLIDPDDGHMDEVHAMRDRVGADLVQLAVARGDFARAQLGGPFSIVGAGSGYTSAHEWGHNLGLLHDRYTVQQDGGLSAHPGYGYVNQRAFEAGAVESSRWRTIMSYNDQCTDAGFFCAQPLRFSNPRESYQSDALGVAYGTGGTTVNGAADAAAVINHTGPAVALWRDPPARANRPPSAAGTVPDRNLALRSALDVDVSSAFLDPDGDALSYSVSSSAPDVVSVMATGARLTLTAASEGTATIRVRATDPGGLSATQLFTVTVTGSSNRPPEPVGALAPLTIGLDEAAVTVDVSGAFRDPDGDALAYGATSSAPAVAAASVSRSTVTVTPVGAGTAIVTVTATDAGGSNTAATQAFSVMVPRPFTDPVIVPGVTPIRAVHFTELRTRIDGLRTVAGLGGFAWTDPVLTAGVTRVRLLHLLDLRSALAAAYTAAARPVPRWTDAAAVGGTTPIRAAHLMELRTAVLTLE